MSKKSPSKDASSLGEVTSGTIKGSDAGLVRLASCVRGMRVERRERPHVLDRHAGVCVPGDRPKRVERLWDLSLTEVDPGDQPVQMRQ